MYPQSQPPTVTPENTTVRIQTIRATMKTRLPWTTFSPALVR